MCKIYLAGPVARFRVFKVSAPGGEQLNRASSQQQRLEEFQTFFEWLCFLLMTKMYAADTMDSKKELSSKLTSLTEVKLILTPGCLWCKIAIFVFPKVDFRLLHFANASEHPWSALSNKRQRNWQETVRRRPGLNRNRFIKPSIQFKQSIENFRMYFYCYPEPF